MVEKEEEPSSSFRGSAQASLVCVGDSTLHSILKEEELYNLSVREKITDPSSLWDCVRSFLLQKEVTPPTLKLDVCSHCKGTSFFLDQREGSEVCNSCGTVLRMRLRLQSWSDSLGFLERDWESKPSHKKRVEVEDLTYHWNHYAKLGEDDFLQAVQRVLDRVEREGGCGVHSLETTCIASLLSSCVSRKIPSQSEIESRMRKGESIVLKEESPSRRPLHFGCHKCGQGFCTRKELRVHERRGCSVFSLKMVERKVEDL